MARSHGFQMRLVPMTNTHHARMEELVIGKDLSWLDSYSEVPGESSEGKLRTEEKR